MTKRYRFYTWSVDEFAFLELRRRLTSDLYTENAGQGFHLLRATRREIEGRFVQRIGYVEEIVSPDGTLSTTERTAYVHTAFRLRLGYCGLLLLQPPRSINPFLHRLSQLLDYDFAVQAAKVNLFRLKRALEKRLGKARVTSVKISGAALAENALADIVVVDHQDALEKALALFPQHRGCIGKIDLFFGLGVLSNIRISASRAGAISTGTEHSETLDALWEAVEEASE